MLISQGLLRKDQLNGKVALVTGAGGGIGFHAAKSLAWLGAKVVIAELDKAKGRRAENSLNNEFGAGVAHFVRTDVGSERSVVQLKKYVDKRLGRVDIILNNATVAVTGAVHDVDIGKWDLSYRVNVRGPVLLLKAFLPGMLDRNEGTVVFVPSSGAAPYLGAYEVFKTAQVELGNTLSSELEKSCVIAFSIGPGIVKTETADRAIHEIAPMYGLSAEGFYNMNASMLLSPEEAGAGFAASIAMAERYKGLEIGSIQALSDAGIAIGQEIATTRCDTYSLDAVNTEKMTSQLKAVITTLRTQVDGWALRSVFERQWCIRDFKKNVGNAAEVVLDSLARLDSEITSSRMSLQTYGGANLSHLHEYYMHLKELLRGYEKDPIKLAENSRIIDSYIEEIVAFISSVESVISRE